MYIRNLILKIALPVSLCFTGFAFSQEKELFSAKNHLKNSDPDSALYILQKIDTSQLKNSQKGLYHYHLGNAYFLIDKHNIAFKQLIKAELFFDKTNDQKTVAEINFKIGQLIEHQKNSDISSKPFFDKYLSYAKSTKDPRKLDSAHTRTGITYLQNNKGLEAIKEFDNAMIQAKKYGNSLRVAILQFNKAVTYKTVLIKLDSALFIYGKTIPVFIENGKKEYVSYAFNNIAEVYKTQGKCIDAIKFYKKADSIELKKNRAKTKIILYENISECYSKTEDYKNAFTYLDKLNRLKDSVNDTQQNIEISKIKEQYDNEKLRANNLEIEAKRIKNRNLLICSIGVIFFGGLTSLLIYKNTKRKQRIAEQEKEIQIQKTDKILKDQELASIDAMLAGQEKERQRLASDLHDSLGGTLATVKLHFEHLKSNPNHQDADVLYTKTDELLQEAYQKVRIIAHEKNSGVMANQGLLPAIKNLAKKVSYGNHLTIDIQDYGLEQRLDNHIEITIFRIIQELITNIIKHANATEIQISLTNHDAILNIIVEDNGKGFDAKKLPQKDGMGLATIEKRIEHLEGTFEIDSTPNKGTNIIINIPI